MTSYAYPQMPGFLPAAGHQQRNSPGAEQSQARITYFITRIPSGLPVPLIPADELPFTVKLQNVPRVLQPQDTYGLQYIGTCPYTGATFKLESSATSSAMQRSNSQPPSEVGHARTQSGSGTGTKQFLAPDAMARRAHANNVHAVASNFGLTSMRPLSAAETAKSWRRSDPVDSSAATQKVIDAILRSEAGAETAERVGYRSRDTTTPPSGIMPDQDKKVFCTHWIMTGDCKFVQQGCRYKHEMPSEAKLKELGIRHTPRWWQVQNAAIKLGGARNTVGPVLKPMEMLGMSKGEDESSSDDSEESESETELAKVDKKQALKMKEDNIGSKQIARSKPESNSPVVPPARPSTPGLEKGKDIRKPSTASDLIDLTPLLPTSPASITSQAVLATTRSVSNSTPHDTVSTGIANIPEILRATTTATKVFVPAGESSELHIADMKKRERIARHNHQSRTPSRSRHQHHQHHRHHGSTSASTTSSNNSNNSHKSDSNNSISKSPSNITAAPNGLQASKHAVLSSSDSPPLSPSPSTNNSYAQRNKAGCRIRRPASVSPSTVAANPAHVAHGARAGCGECNGNGNGGYNGKK